MTPADYVADPNVVAFLKAIRLGEGTGDDDGYRRIVGGQLFDDLSRHPRVRIFIPKYNVYSTAAGAYQIIYPTWAALVLQYKFPDFTPASQDQAAIALIAGRGALDHVVAGRLRLAVAKCAAEWASLPGSLAGQRTEDYAAVEKVYIDSGGTIT